MMTKFRKQAASQYLLLVALARSAVHPGLAPTLSTAAVVQVDAAVIGTTRSNTLLDKELHCEGWPPLLPRGISRGILRGTRQVDPEV